MSCRVCGRGGCTESFHSFAEQDLAELRRNPKVETVRVCGEVKPGNTVVHCECGKYRQSGRPCGYREPAEQTGEGSKP